MDDTKMTLKKAIYMICFVVICFSVLIAGGRIFEAKKNIKNQGAISPRTYKYQGEPENSLQVVGIGNSGLYRGVNPLWMFEDYGFTSYMAAGPLHSVIDSYGVLEDFLKRQSPKVLLWETNQFFVRSGTFEFNTAVTNYLKDKLPMYKYHFRWKYLSEDDFDSDVSMTQTHKYKGFPISVNTRKFDAEKVAEKKLTNDISSIDEIYMDKIFDLCKKNHIDIIFTTIYTVGDWNQKRHDKCQEIADKHNIPYIDFNDEEYIKKLELDSKTDFKDKGMHLNIMGARKTTVYLGEYIHKHYKMTDERENPAYLPWWDSLKLFNNDLYLELEDLDEEEEE